MVLVQSLLRVIDNTGAYYASCIGILTNSRLAYVGDQLVIAIKSLILNKKVTHRKRRKVIKGTVRRAVLLRAG